MITPVVQSYTHLFLGGRLWATACHTALKWVAASRKALRQLGQPPCRLFFWHLAADPVAGTGTGPSKWPRSLSRTASPKTAPSAGNLMPRINLHNAATNKHERPPQTIRFCRTQPKRSVLTRGLWGPKELDRKICPRAVASKLRPVADTVAQCGCAHAHPRSWVHPSCS